jgi:spermidine synthase
MTVELCGARLLSPIYGTSLYVWSSVMAITLAGLAAGYFLGAFFSQKKDTSKILLNVLFSAGIFISLIPFLAYYIVPRISYFNFNLAVLLSSGILLFIPIVALGCTSPLFIKQLASDTDAGKFSGMVYGISTVGGILSTLISGFYIIPAFGFNTTILAFGIILVLTCIITFKKINVWLLIVFVFTNYMSFQINLKSKRSLLRQESLNGTIEVTEERTGNSVSRVLSINNIIQTEYNLTNKVSSSKYLKIIESEILKDSTRGNVLILGLGGGVLCNMLVENGFDVTGVEFDERIINCSRNYFNLNPNVKVIEDDARNFINNNKEVYQYIVFDLFKSEECPAHTVTLESFELVKKQLTANGKLFINWHGYYSGKEGLGTLTLLNTLSAAGFEVNLKSTDKLQAHSNLVWVAKPSKNVSVISSLPINFDNYQLLEKQNALASLQWRKNYLNYYQGKN